MVPMGVIGLLLGIFAVVVGLGLTLDLDGAATQLETKREELRVWVDGHKNDKGEWDMKGFQLDEFHRRHDEVNLLAKTVDVMKAAAANEAALRGMRESDDPDFARRGESARSRRLSGAESEVKGLDTLFIESKAYTGVVQDGVKVLGQGTDGPELHLPQFDVKGLLDGLDTKAVFETGAGWSPESLRRGPVLLSATEPPAVMDFIPTTRTSQNAVKYMEETTYTNAAAETAEKGSFPQASLALTEKTANVRKFSVYIPVTDEELEDEERVRGYLQDRLPYMIRQRVSQEIIAGDGVAPNISGLLTVAGTNTQAKGTDPAPDAIYKAMTTIRVTGKTTATGVLMHPTNWQNGFRLLRTADGLYIWGNPSDAGPERVWGLPVAQSTDVTLNTSIIADYLRFVELCVRRGLTVKVGYINDDFIKGQQCIRCDFRAAFLVRRPSAVTKVTGLS